MLNPELMELIEELATETEQPVVVFVSGGKIQIGVLESQPDDLDWYFEPVDSDKAELLGESNA